MSEDRLTTNSEIDAYVEDLDSWIEKSGAAKVKDSYKGVVDRFVRDCNTLKSDMFGNQKPSSCDMVDYNDRYSSLDVQFHNLQSNFL